jgi:transposase-like protein
MRGPAEKSFDPAVSPLFVNAIHEELRRYDGKRMGESRPCPNCGAEEARKNGYQNERKTVARLVTDEGIEDVGVEVQQYECVACGRSFQGDLSDLFYEGCAYARPVVDLCRFHAVEQSPSACERSLRRMYGLQVNRDTVERYAERFDDAVDEHAVDIGGHRYSLTFLSFLFGDEESDQPHFVIQRSRAIW